MTLLGRKTASQMGKVTGLLIDQSLYSLSHAFLSFAGARWLPAYEFGLLSMLWAIARYTRSLNSAVVIEPMLVYSGTRLKADIQRYLVFLIRFVAAIFVVVNIAVAVVIGGMISRGVFDLVVAFAISETSVLLFNLLRKMGVVLNQIKVSAFGSGIYFLLILVGMFLLTEYNDLSAVHILLLVGVSSFVINIVLLERFSLFKSLCKLKKSTKQICVVDKANFSLANTGYPEARRPKEVERNEALTRSESLRKIILRLHWEYGRWSSLASFVTWIPRNIYYLIFAFLGSVDTAADMRALVNFALPFTLGLNSVSSYLLVYFSKAQGKRYKNLLITVYTLVIVLTLLLAILLGLFHEPLVLMVYGSKYQDVSRLLWLVGASMVVSGVNSITGMVLKSLERPDIVFWSQVVASVGAIAMGFGLIPRWKVAGALMAMVVNLAISSAVLMFSLFRLNTFRTRYSS